MVTPKIGNGEEHYVDGYLHENLLLLKKAVAQNWDGVILIGGMEGAGKSTLGAQIAAVLDDSFHGSSAVDRTCFNLKQLQYAVDKAQPGEAVIYDESWKDMSTSARHSKSQHEIIRMLTEKRKKRLYWIIIAPTFFDITKYLAIHRSRCYVHVYSHGLERGFFSFFNYEKKMYLYINGKRDWNMNIVKPSFRARFASWIPYDRTEYENKKDDSTKAVADENVVTDLFTEKDVEKIRTEEIIKYYRAAKLKRFLKVGAVTFTAEYLGISRSNLDKRIELLNLNHNSGKNTNELLGNDAEGGSDD